MEPAVAPANIYRFGLFEADASGGTLRRNGVRVKIQDQPFRVLIFLLERPGEVVSREELRQRLWPEGTYVDFDGSLNVILKKLRAAIDDDSDNPRFIETVPRRGYRFIAPVSTPPGIEPVAKELPALSPSHAEDTRHVTAAFPAIKRRHRDLLMYGVSIAVLLGLAVAGWRVWRTPYAPGSSSAGAVQVRKSLAVLGFHSLSGRPEDAWLTTALSEMLSTELAGGDRLRLVSGEEIANLRIASPWSQSDTLDKPTTARIGSALSSDMLVLGSYTILGNPDHGQIRLDVRMQDARTGEILTEVAEIGATQDLFRLVSRVGAKLRDRLGVPPLIDTDEAGVLASVPLEPEAARFYALGISKLRKFDALAAKDLLQQATAVQPRFSLAHAMLARAWSQLGYEQKHREEAKKALDLADNLPRPEHMLVEGEYYESIGKQEQAASVYHALYELFPDNVDYGLRFANAATLTGNASQALDVIRRIRALPAPLAADPRIDLAESRAIKINQPASLLLVRSAVSKSMAQGKTPVYALARREECMHLLYGDRPEQAGAVCEDAYNAFLTVGNRAGAADAVRLMADRQGAQGHYELAISTYQRALGLLEGLGEHAKTGAVMNNMAIGYADEGQLDRAMQLYEQAKTHFEQVGDKNNASTAVTNIADILFLQGKLPAAEKQYRQALDLISALDRGDPGYALARIADLELTEGKLKDAKFHAQQAIEAMRPAQGSYQYLTGAMIELGEVLEAEGDLAGAKDQFQQALEIRQKVGEADLVAESQVELANLSMEEGYPDRAEALLRTALAEFEKEKGDPDSANGYVQLSRALLREGKNEEASAALEKAFQFTTAMSNPSLKLSATIQKARMQTASSATKSSTYSAAQQELRSAIGTAKKLGYYSLELEGRRTLGESELKAGLSSARVSLASIASEANGRGFRLAAHQAEQALAASGNVVAQNKSAR